MSLDTVSNHARYSDGSRPVLVGAGSVITTSDESLDVSRTISDSRRWNLEKSVRRIKILLIRRECDSSEKVTLHINPRFSHPAHCTVQTL